MGFPVPPGIRIAGGIRYEDKRKSNRPGIDAHGPETLGAKDGEMVILHEKEMHIDHHRPFKDAFAHYRDATGQSFLSNEEKFMSREKRRCDMEVYKKIRVHLGSPFFKGTEERSVIAFKPCEETIDMEALHQVSSYAHRLDAELSKQPAKTTTTRQSCAVFPSPRKSGICLKTME